MRGAFVLALALAVLLVDPPVARPEPRPRDLMDGAELRHALQKLQVVGSALYVAAHPDDENTAFLSWLSNGRQVRAAYLSITRGDGGQNLIGSEAGEALGVIRTQELLSARRIDGAEQYFTRALDFGYSKGPDETLEIWGRDRILADVVHVIRRFQPDVIVTRFGADGSGGHGHHTASAILAHEAFAAAADPRRFPEQLARVRPWQARRIVWNNWRARPEGRDPALPPLLTVDLGAYEPLLGRAHSEIAGESRSMHKSQGFGAAERRGSIPNYLEHTAGEPAAADLFDGIDLTWRRIAGGERVAELLARAERELDPERPAAILPLLLDAHAALAALPADVRVEAKRAELVEAIRSAAGLWIEAVVPAPTVVPGGRVPVTVSVLNRSSAAIAIDRIELPHGAVARAAGPDSARGSDLAGLALPFNRPVLATATVPVPREARTSQPYWLRARPLAGSFQLDDAASVGDPENRPALAARVTLAFGPRRVACEAPLVHRWVDPVEGERYRDLEILPPATARIDPEVLVFPDDRPRELRVVVESVDSALARAAVALELPAGWTAHPARAEVSFARGVREASARFTVSPPRGSSSGAARVRLETAGGRLEAQRLVRIDYPHIPIQTLLRPAEARLLRADVAHAGSHVGYLMGSGDAVPEALRQIGYRVTLLDDADLETGDLSRFDAIVAGVRAYNTRPRLRALQPRLLDWVAAGGRLVVQYQTAEPGLGDRLGPLPFTISRERVSVEQAEVRILKPDHPLLREPNRIEPADFAGWVQERGLYFASPWDAGYEALLSANDPGEPPRDGGLIVARHGRGTFVYTGLAWFRQLPAGVPGAYRLFANLVSASGQP